YLDKTGAHIHFILFKQRAVIYDTLQQVDSAYYYFTKFHDSNLDEVTKSQLFKIKNITAAYENEKIKSQIKSKNYWIIFILLFTGVIALSSILLYIKNTKIRTQNVQINDQLAELQKLLDQKKILLKELQHRVKNNLQHVNSILEMQKEYVDTININEIIRETQNRIHTMSMLHRKLNNENDINEVNLGEYIHDLSQLVLHSYKGHENNLDLEYNINVQNFPIEQALPLGLITVELISNTLKHGFKTSTKSKKIEIEIINTDPDTSFLYTYKDNGIGFDQEKWESSHHGLGHEIIIGMTEQLDGVRHAHRGQGFEYQFSFKI
ncbi:MAG: sensor histidine kinase, partial [Chitinophagales bacterium]|nr:sensor histidine kinase [Chitinophagales bacterium]